MIGREWTAALFLGLAWASVALAADDDPAALQAIVEKSGERFVEAHAKRDSKALAALFTPGAEYVDSSGVVFQGREAIEAEYRAAFEAMDPGALDLEILSIRPVAEGVLVEDGLSTFRPEGDGPVSQLRYTVTHVKQKDGGWLMASVRELTAPEATPHERLKALAWLVGKWREEVGGGVTATEWKWSDEGNFLVAEFTIADSRGDATRGTHRVGWDAERKQFRSWIFDAEGGFLEGTWNANDDGSWSVQLNGVTADGTRRATTLTYTRDGDEAFVVTRDQSRLGDQALPSAAHRVVRAPTSAE